MLLDWAHVLPECGMAFDAGAGVGTNGLFLAARGLRVIAMDYSEVALKIAAERARSDSLPLRAAVYDLKLLHLPDEYFDVIVNFFFLERVNLEIYRRALHPGGVLFFETLFRNDPMSVVPEHYLERGELLHNFAGFDILHWAEAVECGENKFSEQLVARKPSVGELGPRTV